MSLFKKKPVVVEAFKWTGDMFQNEDPVWITEAIQEGSVYFGNVSSEGVVMKIDTLEGTMTAQRGDYIIKGIKGELYPCKPDIFEETYELVND